MIRKFSDKGFTLGILGGGQLGRMLLQRTLDFNVSTAVLDGDADAPCRNLCDRFVNASFNDFQSVYDFGKTVDLLTIEIEHVNTDALKQLQNEGLPVYPQPSILEMVKDKGIQKNYYHQHDFPTADFVLCNDRAALSNVPLKFPLIQKLRTGGYDGKGVLKINSPAELYKAFDAPSVIESCIDLKKEISVIVARNQSGQVAAYPAVEMIFNKEANLVEFLSAPADISDTVARQAEQIARELIEQLELIGILAVEMFVTDQDQVLINEIAPRPHNSGHQTIEANVTSQFEQQLRALFNLPLGSVQVRCHSVMFNILGEKDYEGAAKYEGLFEVLQMTETHLHLYGKKLTRPFRKMGHLTVTGKAMEEVKLKAALVKRLLKVKS